MFGLPAWLTVFLILYAVMIIGVWVLSFSNILFDEEADEKEEHKKSENERRTGGESV